MPDFLKRFRRRSADAAAGEGAPAGDEVPPAGDEVPPAGEQGAPAGEEPARPRPLARGKMRRRLRQQQRVREALLLDLGALVFELHRQGRREPELLQAKAAELTAVDREVRALAEALDGGHATLRLVAPGIVGSCESCGTLLTSDARFCSRCGAPAGPALSGRETTEAAAGLEVEGDGAPQTPYEEGHAEPVTDDQEELAATGEDEEQEQLAAAEETESAEQEELAAAEAGEAAEPYEPVEQEAPAHRPEPRAAQSDLGEDARRLLRVARRRARRWVERRRSGAS